MMNKYLLIIAFTLVSLFAFSQARQISGRVSDAAGQGLPGVTVLVKGTGSGTTTNIEGNYSLNVEAGNTIQFSFMGFVSQDIVIVNQSVINITLLEDSRLLDEVVVVGYGIQKKRDITSAVAIVDSKVLKDRPIISVAQALQGTAAGVQVTQTSGKPGGGIAVRVRGATSVLAGNEPAYIVDGIRTTDISGLNPNDIESMSILKDAAASAIYGAAAANGVVIITTKRGKSDTPVVSFNTYFGISKLRKSIDVLNTRQYRDLMNDIGIAYDPTWTNFNDWMDETFSTGYQQSYQASVSGGSEKSRYFVSGGYLTEQGMVRPARFDRYTIRMNLDNELRPWLRLKTSLTAWNLDTKDTPDNSSSGRGGVIMSALNTPPFLNVFKNDGSGWYDQNPFQSSWENPVAYMDAPDQFGRENKLLGTVDLEIDLIKGLKLKSNVGTDITSRRWDYYLDPISTNYGRVNNGIGRSDNSSHMVWQVENYFDYSKKWDEHNLSVIGGNTLRKYEGRGTYVEAKDFPADTDIKDLWAANQINTAAVGTWHGANALVSFFGRLNYDFDSKYYATFSLRRDGSSKLVNKWGTMPAFSLGYRLSSAGFMQNLTFIDDLKIRGGYGETGNVEGLSDHAAFALWSYYRRTPDSTLAGPGIYQSSYGNPDLKWETTKQTSLGFDLTMWQGRLVFNFDAYYKKTVDVLLNVPLTASLPVSSILTNAGEIVNKGIEFNFNTVNIDQKDLKWSSNFNLSFNKNEVTNLVYSPIYDFGRIYSNNEYASRVMVGSPLGTFFGYVSEGVNPETGNITYKDVNNNGIFDPGDRTVIGYGMPKHTFGFTNNIIYKRFSTNIFFQGSYGNDIFNATRIDLEGMFDSKNQSTAVLDRWTPENTNTEIPRAAGGGNVDNVRNSTRFIEDGSYLRLKSITLSYNVLNNNPRFTFIKNLSVYVTGQNLFTFTKYSGFDPEVNAYGSSAVEVGIDYGTYPQSRTIIFGLNVEF
ncbi:MAG: TonB-dependent receptor [Bacteroidetes bacterium HGW-Bacteroidetes-11]|nr:MAG: TonB-dependent receptor [Bacteroidetes bacterium HGW-Bacteroidetes-11]